MKSQQKGSTNYPVVLFDTLCLYDLCVFLPPCVNKGRIQKKPYAGVNYPYPLPHLMSTPESTRTHLPWTTRVDLNPVPIFTLSPSQGLRIWLLWVLYAKGICSERKCYAQIQNPIGLGHRAYQLKKCDDSSPSNVSVNLETILCSCFLDRRRNTWKQNVFPLVRCELIIFNYEK